jgi:hypothetical protein
VVRGCDGLREREERLGNINSNVWTPSFFPRTHRKDPAQNSLSATDRHARSKSWAASSGRCTMRRRDITSPPPLVGDTQTPRE